MNQPRIFVRMFQPRFARLVEAGTKRQTVRKLPKRIPRKGDIISCREWTGKPYRSPQRTLVEALLVNVQTVEINSASLTLDGHERQRERFARADGFADWLDLEIWFQQTHGLPFQGIALFW